MEHVKELLHSRIEEIHDPVQKVLLQDVLVDVFEELLKYSEERFSKLEEKIDGELTDPSQKYYIDTGICKKDGLDGTSRCLFEIEKGAERSTGYLGTIFLACEYPTICRCLGETYRARVETSAGDYETTVSLRCCSAYLQKMDWLYRQFAVNKRQWRTVNCPFLYKLLEIIDTKGVVPWDAEVQKVELALGELSEFVINDVVLVWNLREEVYQPSVEVVAAGKEKIYDHQMVLPDAQAGYLAVPEEEDAFTTIFYEDRLSIRTEKEKHKNLNMVKIARPDSGKDHTGLLYPLQTNRRKMRHADRQALLQPRLLFTRGEVERILTSYEVFEDFEFVDICLDTFGEIEVVDCNPFIKTHSFLKEKRKAAVVLHPKDSTDIFRYEKMFFLIAELQLTTDEYEWTGILR